MRKQRSLVGGLSKVPNQPEPHGRHGAEIKQTVRKLDARLSMVAQAKDFRDSLRSAWSKAAKNSRRCMQRRVFARSTRNLRRRNPLESLGLLRDVAMGVSLCDYSQWLTSSRRIQDKNLTLAPKVFCNQRNAHADALILSHCKNSEKSRHALKDRPIWRTCTNHNFDLKHDAFQRKFVLIVKKTGLPVNRHYSTSVLTGVGPCYVAEGKLGLCVT
jgi:hypothetical protein